MVFLVFDDVFEDGDRTVVAEFLELAAVVGDVPALVNFEPAQGHSHAAGTVGKRVGITAGTAFVSGLGAAQFDDAAFPQCGVFPLGGGKVTQNLGSKRIGVAVGESLVGAMALHLGLPVGLEGGENFLQLGGAQSGGRHAVLLALLENKTFRV